MDTVRQWAITVSAVSIICGVLTSLLPKSSHKTLYKTIASILMVYTFLQPMMHGEDFEFSINDYLSENYSVSNNIDEYALSSVVNSAEKAIENLFIQEAEKINIDCSFRCVCQAINNKISVSKLIVTSNDNTDISNEIYKIANLLEINSEVIIFEGETNEHR